LWIASGGDCIVRVRDEGSGLAFLRWQIDNTMCRTVMIGVRSREARVAARKLRSESARARQQRQAKARSELRPAS
jgi:hypothetical protein